MRLENWCLGLALLAATTLAAAAQEPAASAAAGLPGTILSGSGHPAIRLTAADLASRPQTELAISYQASTGRYSGTFRGVLLWTLLSDAGLLGAGDPHAVLRQIVVVTGRDGYTVVFGAGEIAPELGNRQILLATELGGRALPNSENLRLAVPGDKRGARSVRDVVSIAVRSLDP
jgi:hypothetical protein